MPDLLLELFSEEIPARMQPAAARQLHTRMEEGLSALRLEHAGMQPFVCPRHLSIIVRGLPERQPDRTIERKGPKVSAPQAAIDGFVKSTGIPAEQLETRTVGKDACYFAVIEEAGKSAADALKPMIEHLLHDFHWPKVQRWGDTDLQWVRPLRHITCLLGEQVIPLAFGHLEASNITFGHRFLAPDQIVLTDPGHYVEKLEDACVLVDHTQRQALIESELKRRALDNDYELVEDEALLEEVTGLVEWPVILMGEFDARYLELPPEVLVSEMRHHQKYFALKKKSGDGVQDSGGKVQESRNRNPESVLSKHFLIVSNMKPHDNGQAVVHGNERVLRARLEDGQFYWDQDRNTPLSEFARATSGMIFHAELGSIHDKSERIAALSPLLAVFVPHANLTKVARAGELCKADLVSGMVGEFPDLQGVMGRYYAQKQQEDPEVADAIRDHYRPAGATDAVPAAPVSITVAIADRIDSLVGLFAIGEKPTGSKDPYALRRAALGIIRIILHNGLRLPLRILFDKAAAQYPRAIFKTAKDDVVVQLLHFFADRLRVILKDEGIRHDIIQAVFADGDEDDLVLIVRKAQALSGFLVTEDGTNLLAAYRRAGNILAAEEKKDDTRYDERPDADRFELDAEEALYSALEAVAKPVEKALKDEQYETAMRELSHLRAALDRYFDEVLVNDADADIRANRLYTLNLIRTRMDEVVDFGVIEG